MPHPHLPICHIPIFPTRVSSICELGAGLGLVSSVLAAAHHPPRRLLATDGSVHALPYLRANVLAAAHSSGLWDTCSARVSSPGWGSPPGGVSPPGRGSPPGGATLRPTQVEVSHLVWGANPKAGDCTDRTKAVDSTDRAPTQSSPLPTPLIGAFDLVIAADVVFPLEPPTAPGAPCQSRGAVSAATRHYLEAFFETAAALMLGGGGHVRVGQATTGLARDATITADAKVTTRRERGDGIGEAILTSPPRLLSPPRLILAIEPRDRLNPASDLYDVMLQSAESAGLCCEERLERRLTGEEVPPWRTDLVVFGRSPRPTSTVSVV